MLKNCKSIAVDADSIHRKICSVLLNLCMNKNYELVFVADRPLKQIQSIKDKNKLNIRIIRVKQAENSADDWIVRYSSDFLCVITHDIPLAKRIAEKGGMVIDERGTLITEENASYLLSERDYMTKLREYGLYEKTTSSPITDQDVKKFADTLNMIILKNEQ